LEACHSVQSAETLQEKLAEKMEGILSQAVGELDLEGEMFY
jgi:hypothetical protein